MLQCVTRNYITQQKQCCSITHVPGSLSSDEISCVGWRGGMAVMEILKISEDCYENEC